MYDHLRHLNPLYSTCTVRVQYVYSTCTCTPDACTPDACTPDGDAFNILIFSDWC